MQYVIEYLILVNLFVLGSMTFAQETKIVDTQIAPNVVSHCVQTLEQGHVVSQVCHSEVWR